MKIIIGENIYASFLDCENLCWVKVDGELDCVCSEGGPCRIEQCEYNEEVVCVG